MTRLRFLLAFIFLLGSSGVPFGQDSYGGRNRAADLVRACGAKGLGVDFVTGNCVSPQGRQINPHNLYQPFTAPLPQLIPMSS
jgi:hypothetical protein